MTSSAKCVWDRSDFNPLDLGPFYYAESERRWKHPDMQGCGCDKCVAYQLYVTHIRVRKNSTLPPLTFQPELMWRETQRVWPPPIPILHFDARYPINQKIYFNLNDLHSKKDMDIAIPALSLGEPVVRMPPMERVLSNYHRSTAESTDTAAAAREQDERDAVMFLLSLSKGNSTKRSRRPYAKPLNRRKERSATTSSLCDVEVIIIDD